MRSRQALGLRNRHYFLSEGIPLTCGFVSSSKRWLRCLSSTALCLCSGVMSIFWQLQASLPASSRMLAVRYSRTPVRKTGVCQLRRSTQHLARRRSTRLTGNCSSALVERERACFMAQREHWRLLCPDIMFTGCCPDRPRWIVTLTCASQDTSAYFWLLYPCAPASHWSRRCLCDSSDFVMSLVTTGPDQDWPRNVCHGNLVSFVTLPSFSGNPNFLLDFNSLAKKMNVSMETSPSLESHSRLSDSSLKLPLSSYILLQAVAH